jgi:transcriptional activator SPT7
MLMTRTIRNGDTKPRKRSRMRTILGALGEKPDPVELWWAAATSPALLANGVPAISHASDYAPVARSSPNYVLNPVKKKKKVKKETHNPSSLLRVMSENIRTMKRVRHSHARLSALLEEVNANGEGDEVIPGANVAPSAIAAGVLDEGADTVDDVPWRPTGTEGQKRTRHVNQSEAEDCLKWMSGRVVEHAGSVVGEYLLNVGRTMRFLQDKYVGVMTPEVRIDLRVSPFVIDI